MEMMPVQEKHKTTFSWMGKSNFAVKMNLVLTETIITLFGSSSI